MSNNLLELVHCVCAVVFSLKVPIGSIRLIVIKSRGDQLVRRYQYVYCSAVKVELIVTVLCYR